MKKIKIFRTFGDNPFRALSHIEGQTFSKRLSFNVRKRTKRIVPECAIFSSYTFFRHLSYTIVKGGIDVSTLFFALFFVVLFSVILQIFLKNPYIVTGITAIAALMAFVLFFDTVGLNFIIWIFIYVIASFITALLTCKFFHNYHNHDGF